VMNNDQLQQRKERAGNEPPLVISQTDEGFCVFSASSPGTTYLVTGNPEAPACTCPDFEYHRNEPHWRCKHIWAVLNQFEFPVGQATDSVAAEERRAIQNEGRLSDKDKKKSAARNNGTAQMVLKRSVSPDRRIDSLSVEFTCPTDKATPDEIKSQAIHTLKLQSEIVNSFLGSQKGGNGNQSNGGSKGEADNTVPAQLLNVGGMDGKWGRRLFINVQMNGHTAKLFGNSKQLGDALAAAGFPALAEHVAEGMKLNLPCRVTTKPSEDGKFLNVERVLPGGTGR
jgi:hypothetical protein